MQHQRPRYPADDNGGTCRSILNLANGPEPHPHRPGQFAVMHSDAPPNTRPKSGVIAIQMLDVLPADLHCGHCAPSRVTLMTATPGCVAGAFEVRHQSTCPMLARLLRKFGVRL